MTTLIADGIGPYVQTFTDYVPAPRLDAVPWTRVVVEESQARGGPWTQYAHGTLSPADVTPAVPLARSFTAPGASIPVGWNRVTFTDEAGSQQPFTPAHVGDAWTPRQSDVAVLLRSRLFAGGGRSAVFLDEADAGGPTDPTADEVGRLIDDAASDLITKVGFSIPVDVQPAARRVVALGTAMLIELGAEGFDQDRYDRLEKLYDTRLAQLLDAAQDEAEGGEAGDADDRVTAAGDFPAAATHWDWERF